MLVSIWNYTETGTKQFQSLTSYESFTSSFICMLNDKHNCCSFAVCFCYNVQNPFLLTKRTLKILEILFSNFVTDF